MPKKKKIKELQNSNDLQPQQIEFLSLYLNPKSKTFGNAYQSALKAKYSDTYAQNITEQLPKWLSENIGDKRMLNKAIENLDEFLHMDIKNRAVTKKGDVFEFDDNGKLRVKFDATKFIAERLGRKKFGQEKANVIVPIQFNIDEDRERFS